MSTATEAAASPGSARARGTPATGGRPERVRGLRLRTRLFLCTAALLALTLALAIAFVGERAGRVAEEKIREDLKAVPAVYEGYVQAQASARERQVRSLAEQAGTKALLSEVHEHPETFQDTAAGYARALDARAVFFFDDHAGLLSRSDRASGEEVGRDFHGVSWVDKPLRERRETSAFILELRHARILSLVAAAPVVQGSGIEGRLTGVVAASFPMTQERASELARLTQAETAIVANVAPRGTTPQLQVLASTLGRGESELVRAFAPGEAAWETVFGRGEAAGPLDLTVAGQSYLALGLPVRSGGGETIAAVIVARSREAEMRPFRAITANLIGVGAGALLLAVPLSFVLAQGLSRPIRQLAEGALKIARGDLDVVLPPASGEVGSLTQAFESMLAELKEKAQLEALVAHSQRRPGDVTYHGAAPRGATGQAGLGAGRVFAGRYEIVSALGSGSMGAVYRARDRELDDEVALKVLSAEADGTAQAERARQEFRLARQITHPNVVRAYDFGEVEGLRFFTMEYVPGTTLRELVDRHAGLEPTPALQIAKQICRGLAAVHKAGIVHGDLKPQNVMVMGNGVAKLMDFGVARARARPDASGLLVSGTPLYMSPEQARGAELDDRSDIYSAGVVMFEMFTGRLPFEGEDASEIMAMHLNDPPPDPRALRPGLPEPIAQIILACLSKHRLERPAAAIDLDRLLMRVRLS
jgi:eukaryotic-like serine/threonine-protein kinase